MGKLKDAEIRTIVNRATMFQKFYGTSSTNLSNKELENDYPDLFKITDSLNINRSFVCEALLEYGGIPVDEAVHLDAGFSNAEVLGYSRGELSPDLLNELRAQIEYHFNTVGKISHRKNKTSWKATPTGLSRLIASSNSPEVHFENAQGNIRIRVKQSLKTVNKWFVPVGFTVFGAFMLISANIFQQIGTDGIAPSLFVASFILIGSYFFSRFVQGRKKKKKNALAELAETLQQTIERRYKISISSEKVTDRIKIPDHDNTEEIEISSSKEKLSS